MTVARHRAHVASNFASRDIYGWAILPAPISAARQDGNILAGAIFSGAAGASLILPRHYTAHIILAVIYERKPVTAKASLHAYRRCQLHFASRRQVVSRFACCVLLMATPAHACSLRAAADYRDVRRCHSISRFSSSPRMACLRGRVNARATAMIMSRFLDQAMHIVTNTGARFVAGAHIAVQHARATPPPPAARHASAEFSCPLILMLKGLIPHASRLARRYQPSCTVSTLAFFRYRFRHRRPRLPRFYSRGRYHGFYISFSQFLDHAQYFLYDS